MCSKSKRKRIRLAREQGGLCYYCGVVMTPVEMTPQGTNLVPTMETLEHLEKKEDGGTLRNDNVVAACLLCNSSREDIPVDVWKIICNEYCDLAAKRKRVEKWSARVFRSTMKKFGYTQNKNMKLFKKYWLFREKYILPISTAYYRHKQLSLVNSYLHQ